MLGEGSRTGRGEGLLGLKGGRGGDDGGDVTKMGFFRCIMRSCMHEFAAKKNKGKIARCSGMSKFCPHTAALRESIRGNKYERTQLCADEGWWGGR